MNIENLGQKTVEQLVEKGLVQGPRRSLRADGARNCWGLDGFAGKSARKAVRSHRRCPENRSWPVSSTPSASAMSGEHVARVLAGRFGSLAALRQASLEELRGTGEVGPEIAAAVKKFFEQEKNRQVLDKLEGHGVEVKESFSPAPGDLPLAGRKFVFTGQLEGFTRQEAEAAVERLGGRATSSVSGETDIVVAGSNPGSKLDEAKKKKIRIIDEKEFEKLLG